MENLSAAQVLPVRREGHAIRQKWIIEEYIERHFTEDVGLEDLANELFLSQRQTRKLVRQFLGEDYKSVIIRRRMELAEIYLRDPERNLEDIAWQVGYRSYSGFQLCFKKYFGITPSQFRQKHQN
jgi:AraC-like DNA-binding protein